MNTLPQNDSQTNRSGCLTVIGSVLGKYFAGFRSPKRKTYIIGTILGMCLLCSGMTMVFDGSPAGQEAARIRHLTETANPTKTPLGGFVLPAVTQTNTITATSTSTSQPIVKTATFRPTRTIRPTATIKARGIESIFPTATYPQAAPATDNGHPAGTSGRCNDGNYTSAAHRQGACSHHGGIAEWWGN